MWKPGFGPTLQFRNLKLQKDPKHTFFLANSQDPYSHAMEGLFLLILSGWGFGLVVNWADGSRYGPLT